MAKVLCATRGGEASIRTQQAAIAEAKAAGDTLTFIYVFDIEFMAHAIYSLRSDVVKDEMLRMADFLMTMAVERAQKAGVEAGILIREGNFAEELATAAAEIGARRVILGRPAEQGHFEMDALQALAERLTAETGIEFCIRP